MYNPMPQVYMCTCIHKYHLYIMHLMCIAEVNNWIYYTICIYSSNQVIQQITSTTRHSVLNKIRR